MDRRDNTQRLIKGQHGTIETYPPFDVATAITATVTVRVGTPSTALPTSASAATQDATVTTLSAAAAQGDTTLTVASMTAFATRRRFLVKGTDGLYHDVEVEPLAADVTAGPITLTEPLPFAAPSGASVLGFRCTASLSSTDTATIGPGVAEWIATYTDAVDGAITHKWSTAFRIVERDGTYTLTPAVLTSSSPYCRDNKPDNDDDYTETIDAAWRRFVEPDLLAKALRPERIVHGPHFEPVHIAACEFYLALEFEDDAQRRAERKQLLATAMEKVLHASDLWITSEVEDLTNADPNALGLSGNLQGTMPIGMYPDGTPVFASNDLDVCFIER